MEIGGDYPAHVFSRLATPGSYQPDLTCAVLSTLWQCPILLFNPGYPHWAPAAHFSRYIPPLFTQEVGRPTPPVPILQTWTRLGGGAKAELGENWNPNHFEPMFLTQPEDYRALGDSNNPFYLPPYYRQRDPQHRWGDCHTCHITSLSEEEQRAILDALQQVASVLTPAARAPQRRRKPEAPQTKATTSKHATARSSKQRKALLASQPTTHRGLGKRKRNTEVVTGREKITKKAGHADTSRQLKHKAQAPPSPTAAEQQRHRGENTRQQSIQEALRAAQQQASQKALAPERRAARLTEGKAVRRPPPSSRPHAATAKTAKRACATAVASPEQLAPTPLPSACAREEQPDSPLDVITFNCMGGTTVETAIAALADRDPDVLVLTELKINSRQQRRNLYRRLLHKGFAMTFSLLPGGSLLSNRSEPRRGKAGLLIAVEKRHTTHQSMKQVTVPDSIRGHIAHVRLSPPAGRPQDVVGAYMPTDSSEHHIRCEADAYIEATTDACEQEGRTLISAGDWNATIRDVDRSTVGVSAADREHRRMVQACQLAPAGGVPANPATPRTPTYCQHAAAGETSTIDDV